MTSTNRAAISPPHVEQPTGRNGFSLAEPASEDGRLVSEAEYWADYYSHPDFSYEWNNGRLEERPVSDYAQFRLYVWFLSLLKDFLHVHPIARMVGLELGFRLALPQKVTIRKPDLGVVLNTNSVPLADKDRSYRGVFDLCIESLSDSSKKDVERDTVVKKQEYAAAGVAEYYILDENGRDTVFYELRNGLYVPLPQRDGVIRSRVLPGFQFRLADLYRLPEPPDMIDDSVYQGFVSPFLRAERVRAEEAEAHAEESNLRAEQAEVRAEQAEARAKQAEAYAQYQQQRAEQAEQRLLREQELAQRYAARLKALGIPLDNPE
jgi:Uma2 family endonuclease